MGAYATAPTIVRWWYVGDRNGKQVEVSKDITIAPSSQGGATNTIGKTILGFSQINSVQLLNFTDGSDQNRAIFVWTTGTNVLLGDPQVTTDADRGEPLDMTGTLTIRITGYPV